MATLLFAELQPDRAAAIVEEKPNCMELCRQLVLCSFGLVITSSVTCGAHHLQLLHFRWNSLLRCRVWFHGWVDGSPQFRGRKMFAMTADIVIPGELCEWRLSLCVSLRNFQLDATSKIAALLWVVVVMCGLKI